MPALDDKCVEKVSLDEVIEIDPALAELFQDDAAKKNPTYKCFICEGYNYSCEEYKINLKL